MARIAVIERKKCNPEGCGNLLCIRVCPINRAGKECIVKWDDSKPKINEGLCTGCGICQNRCPFAAISIINLPEELTKKPIHQYGENGFHLYNLPTPIFGKVVGVLGVNGIGKSTAIKILAGVLRPNLGDLEKEANYDELLQYFKGTEAQKFFENLRDGKAKVSYKPQQVELIPKNAKGKVIGLLKKVDEKGRLDEIAELLDITEILGNDIDKISGGELQRVAIAAAVLKKANLYIFDEPTSFLDIKQRIKVSRFIRSLADEKTAVMVVEHDLIILDYMTDLVHLTYGKENCYGIVSGVKATKNGINVYLSGYLKEENIRFRDSKIQFIEKPPEKRRSTDILTSWNHIRKNQGSFGLIAEKGDIFKKEVVGILGSNGTGKTTFVKILAGVTEKDSGEVTEKVRVSYKPQYIESGTDTVMDALFEAAEKHSNDIIGPLNIKPLLERKLVELSGGELQRVAIAKCLANEADLYLLDEPSAYLDSEQRLLISKIIRDTMDKRGKSCLVVDHDLLFIDYLSQKLMVFEGKPAISGEAKGPYPMEEGMNRFLKDLNMSLRRDPETGRPRVNKEDSFKDREQKEKGKLYYS